MFSAVGLFILLWLSPTIPRIRAENDKPVIREHPLDVLVDKNDPATLRCNVTGDNVKITWYKDDQPVNIGNAAHRLILPNGSLFLLRADHDLGTYHCTATNDHGEVSSQSAHVRQASLREEFRVRPHNVNAVLGQKAVLECSPPRGFPEPSVSWRKDDEPLEDDRRFQLDPSGNLVIENVQRSDSGVYQCVAMNMVGERISGPARLSVSEKPRFLVEPKDSLNEVNTSVVFDCRVAGEPSPTISWKKRNCVPVIEGGKCSDSMPIGRAYITDDSRGLQIDRVQPEDEGDYVCVAKNSAGEIETSAKLRVQAPPKIVKAPKNQKLKPGETAEFDCEVTGRPAPGVVWSKEGERRFTLMSGQDLNGRIEVLPAGTLRIKEVNEFDVGHYVCAAVNSVGSALKKTMLTLEMDAANAIPPPQITYGPSNQTLLAHDIAILPCQFTPAPPGRDPPNVSWFHNSIPINRDDHRFSVSPSGTLKISDLSKEDAGNYTCQVESAYGYNSWSGYLQVEEHTNPSAVFERMPDRSQLPAAPSQPRVNVRRPNQIDIEWDPPTNHGASPVTHYTLQYWNPNPGSKTTWTTVNDRINGLKYRLVGVQPGQQYFFIVRANNALGMGEPSPMSQMALTYADLEPKESSTPETTVTLQKPVRLTHAKTINSSTALLTWTNGEGLNNDGFYLTWRGPPLANGETIMNITEPKVSSVLVNGLKPFSTYDFFLIPYKNSMNLSPSNSIELRTPEGIPDPPRNVFARMENLTSVLISFGPPIEIRGILKGFDIQFRDNSSENVNTIRTRANARSVTLRNLAPNRSYQAHVAALNGEGRSEYVSTELFTMNEATLQRHHQLYGRHETAVSPWKIGAGAGFLALFLALGAILAFCWCRYGGNKKRKNSLRHRPPSTDFIKINDGSVATGREEYWPESAMPFHIPPPPPPPNGLSHQCSGMTVHSHMGNMNSQMNMSSPRSAHYFHHHPCCAPMMNAYGTTVRPHYAGPYCAGSSTLGREEGQYHYAVLPPTSTLPHHAIMHYEDDPSPYASTTVTSNGYGPTIPSNPPPMFIPQQLQQNFPPNGSIRRTATQPAQSTNSSSNLQGRRTPRTNPHFFNEVPAPAPQQDMELGRILAQVPPPPTQTYDSVTEDFMNVPKEEGNKDLPNRTTNSRSPPRSRNGTADHEERFLLK